VTVAGKRELVREYSDTLLIFLLKGMRPAKDRERYDVVVEAGESLVQAMARGRARALALSAGEEKERAAVLTLQPGAGPSVS
jgi:hypothetical protein